MYLSLLWCPTAPFISLVRVPSSHSALKSEKSWLQPLCSCHLMCLTHNAIAASNPCPSPMVRPLKVCPAFCHCNTMCSSTKFIPENYTMTLERKSHRFLIKFMSLRARKMVQLWRSVAALPRNVSLIPSTYVRIVTFLELQLQRDLTLLASTGTSSPSSHTYIHNYFKFIILYCVEPQNGHTRKATENIVSCNPCKDLKWTRYNSTHLWSQLWGCWGRRIANSRPLWTHSKKKNSV